MSTPTAAPSSSAPSIESQSQSALSALLSSPKTPSITPSVPPTSSTTPDSYTTAASYDFPDGGRFRVSLSGPPFTPFVDGQHGLPDGFLMEINNYIFSTLCHHATPTPRRAVASILEKAAALYAAFTDQRRNQAPAADHAKMDTSRMATATLMKQLSMLDGQDTRADGFVAKPSGDNLYIWVLHLYFDPALQAKLSDQGHESLELELRFPADYPYSPPFVRVVAPFIKCRYVLPRGGICMQLFSTSGWTPANSIDAVCVQVRAMLLAGGLEIVKNQSWKYSYDGAKRDLQIAVRHHRWDEVDRERDVSRRKKMKY